MSVLLTLSLEAECEVGVGHYAGTKSDVRTCHRPGGKDLRRGLQGGQLAVREEMFDQRGVMAGPIASKECI